MSVKIFDEVAERFLTDDDRRVLAIKGDWGVGKTHAWRDLVARVGGRMKPTAYCYVSLFGLSSIKDVRMAMLGGIGSSEKAEDQRAHWGAFLSSALSRVRPVIGQFTDTRIGKGLSVTLEVAAPYVLRNMVVCFDDFERTGSQLSHDELMGFISTLKESAGCKIVLILNEEKLAKHQTAYSTYREKVVDQEIVFSPTPDEAIAWGIPADLPMRQTVMEGAQRLKIVNVRVLKRISYTVRLLAQHLAQIRAEVQREAVSSAVVLGWCYFDRSGSTPDTDFIQKWNALVFSMDKKKEQPTAAQLQWVERLNDIGFMSFDDLDGAILKVIEQGYVQGSGFESEAANRVKAYENGDLVEAFRSAWALYHASFDNNAQQVVEALDAMTRRAVSIVNPADLNATVVLMRELDRDDVADGLIHFYIAARQQEEKLFDLSSDPFMGGTKDPAMSAAFAEQFRKLETRVTLRQAVEVAARNAAWSQDERIAVNGASAEDFYLLFKGPLAVQPRKAIDASFTLASSLMPEDAVRAKEKIIDALRRIAAESKINALRLDWLFRDDSGVDQGRKGAALAAGSSSAR